jgi:c-di-GMP-binding flagellar brake protein YcgR
MHKPRNYSRTNIVGTATIHPENEPTKTIRADLANLSFGGCCVYAREQLAPDAVIEFVLSTELSGEQLSGKGKIKHVKESSRFGKVVFTVGIEFIDTNREVIVNLLNIYRARINQAKMESSRPKPKYEGPF